MTKPAPLPKGAPRSLRRFVACEIDSASLDLTETEWLKDIPLIGGAEITAAAGENANEAKLTIQGEYVSTEVDVSIVDGELKAEIPGPAGVALNGSIKDWTDKVNATLGDNDKQFGDLAIDGTQLSLTKTPIAAAAVDSAAAVTLAAPVTAPAVAVAETPKKKIGLLAGLGIAVTTVVVVIGVVLFGGGDADKPVETVAGSAVADPPVTDHQPDDQPADSAEDSSPPDEVSSAPATNDEGAQLAMARCGEPSSGADMAYGQQGQLMVPAGPCAANVDRTMAYTGCDSMYLPCSSGQMPPFFVAGQPGIDHTRQVIDVATGDTSNSTFEQWLDWVSSGDLDRIEVSMTCSGRRVTGAVDNPTGGQATIDVALFSYGPCDDIMVTAWAGAQQWLHPQPGTFVVDGNEPDAVPSDAGLEELDTLSAEELDELLVVPASAHFGDAVNTLNNVIGGQERVDDGCLFFFDSANVELVTRALDGCSFQNHFWVFAAATTNVDFEMTVTDTALGTTATYANPLGQVAPSSADISAFNASEALFDAATPVFPCGFGQAAYTACPPGEPAMDTGAFVTVSGAFGGPVPLLFDGAARAHHVDFSSVGGPMYSVTQDGGDWFVESSAGDTRARALIRANAITLVAPHDELPEGALSYQWSTEVDGARVQQPVIPVVGVINAPESVVAAADVAASTDDDDDGSVDVDGAADVGATETVASEPLDEFYMQLSASVSAGDVEFALERLDPRVLEVYPDSCPAALASFADPDLVIKFISEGDVEDWIYEAESQSVEVPNAVAVTIQLSGRGQAGTPSEAHLSLIDGQYHWFTFC